MHYLSDITSLYQELVDNMAGRARVHVTTAHDLPEEKIEELKVALEELVQKKVLMEVKQDPSLIGGVVTKIGGTVYDGSIKTHLENFKELLTKG